MDGQTAYESTHHLLLAFAGRVDDDILCWARELVAVGEEARAVSLLTADVVAERTPLPEQVRTALVAAGRAARVDIDADLLAPAADDGTPHRFAAAPAGVPDLAPAVRSLPARQLQGATTVHLTWRLTPAGAAPGPLPHPVVLVEIDPGRHAGEMLAYQLAAGLARTGVHASVEVVGEGQEREPYHEAAFAAANPIPLAATPTAVPADEPVTESQQADDGSPGTEPAPVPLAAAMSARMPPAHVAEDGSDDVEPEDLEDGTDGEPAAVVEDGTADVASQGPDAGAADDHKDPLDDEPVFDPTHRHPLADDPVDVSPLAPRVRRDTTPPAALSPLRPAAGAPALSALSDPLSGPVNEPLLAPLLDPTIHAHDPLGVDHLVGPSQRPRPRPQPAEPVEPAASVPVVDPAPAPAPVENSWAAEWESGAWAMSVDDLDEAPSRTGNGAAPSDRPGGGPSDPDRRPRHRIDAGPEPRPAEPCPVETRAMQPTRAPEQPRPVGPRAPEPPVPERPQRPAARRPEPEPEPAGGPASDDTPARLSEADRELLARLQAELVEGRKPRVSRRAGVASPANRPSPNGRSGHGHRGDPPDMAG